MILNIALNAKTVYFAKTVYKIGWSIEIKILAQVAESPSPR
jgi:hypothetical protein